jgi:hypothetical protein
LGNRKYFNYFVFSFLSQDDDSQGPAKRVKEGVPSYPKIDAAASKDVGADLKRHMGIIEFYEMSGTEVSDAAWWVEQRLGRLFICVTCVPAAFIA